MCRARLLCYYKNMSTTSAPTENLVTGYYASQDPLPMPGAIPTWSIHIEKWREADLKEGNALDGTQRVLLSSVAISREAAWAICNALADQLRQHGIPVQVG